ncbi:MAG: hypothetical protein AAF800_03010 [Planctomycetota bacterium]
MMTQEREAKCWMLAAMVVVVWAVALVGCGSVPSGVGAAADGPGVTGPDRSAWVWSSGAGGAEASAVTLSRDAGSTVAAGPAASEVVTPASDAVGWLRDLAGRTPATPRFELGLRGLSLAQPLVSAQRVWHGVMAALPPIGTPARVAAMSAVVHAQGQDDALASAAALSLAGSDLPRLQREASAGLGEAVRSAAWPRPWDPEPGRPGLGLGWWAEHARLEDAGVLGGLVGVLLLMFGAESLVKRWRERRRGGVEVGASLGAAVEAAALAQDEPSIFRFPEPIGEEPAEGDAAPRRAA